MFSRKVSVSCNPYKWWVPRTTVVASWFPAFSDDSFSPSLHYHLCFFWKIQPSHVVSLLTTLISVTVMAHRLKSESSTCRYKVLNDLTFYFSSFMSRHLPYLHYHCLHHSYPWFFSWEVPILSGFVLNVTSSRKPLLALPPVTFLSDSLLHFVSIHLFLWLVS